MTNENELKECPFCGENATLIEAGEPWIRCNNPLCMATVVNVDFIFGQNHTKRVVEKWNTRHNADIPERQGESLELANSAVLKCEAILVRHIGALKECIKGLENRKDLVDELSASALNLSHCLREVQDVRKSLPQRFGTVNGLNEEFMSKSRHVSGKDSNGDGWYITKKDWNELCQRFGTVKESEFNSRLIPISDRERAKKWLMEVDPHFDSQYADNFIMALSNTFGTVKVNGEKSNVPTVEELGEFIYQKLHITGGEQTNTLSKPVCYELGRLIQESFKVGTVKVPTVEELYEIIYAESIEVFGAMGAWHRKESIKRLATLIHRLLTGGEK